MNAPTLLVGFIAGALAGAVVASVLNLVDAVRWVVSQRARRAIRIVRTQPRGHHFECDPRPSRAVRVEKIRCMLRSSVERRKRNG